MISVIVQASILSKNAAPRWLLLRNPNHKMGHQKPATLHPKPGKKTCTLGISLTVGEELLAEGMLVEFDDTKWNAMRLGLVLNNGLSVVSIVVPFWCFLFGPQL